MNVPLALSSTAEPLERRAAPHATVAHSFGHEVISLDGEGVIESVNDAWTAFCAANGGDQGTCGVGASYLAVCDAAAGDPEADAVAVAIRRVLTGDAFRVAPIRIGCHAPDEQRWFDVLVSARVDAHRVVGATVALVPTEAVPLAARPGETSTRAVDTVLAAIGEHESDAAEGDVLRVLAASLRDLLGVAAVAITVRLPAAERHQVFASHGAVVPLAQLEVQADVGPGVEAYRGGRPVVTADLAGHRDEWPDHVATALALGYRAALMLPLGPSVPALGVLALYGDTAREWSAAELAVAQAYAHVGSVFLATAHSAAQATAGAARLRRALERNGVIEQAKGLVAGEYRIALDDAFDLLRRYARSHRLTARELAGRVVTEGFRPPRRSPAPRPPTAGPAGRAGSGADRLVAPLDVMNDVFRVGLAIAPLSARDDDLGAFAEATVAALDRCIADIRVAVSGRARDGETMEGGALTAMERVTAQLERVSAHARPAADDATTRTLVDAAIDARRLVARWRASLADLRP